MKDLKKTRAIIKRDIIIAVLMSVAYVYAASVFFITIFVGFEQAAISAAWVTIGVAFVVLLLFEIVYLSEAVSDLKANHIEQIKKKEKNWDDYRAGGTDA